MDASSIQAGLSGLSASIEIAKAAINFRDATIKREELVTMLDALIDAKAQVVSAQSSVTQAKTEVGKLEAQIAKLKDWSVEKARYELHKLKNGGFVYRIRENEIALGPPHYLCPNCYSYNLGSILQPEVLAAGRVDVLVCLRCDAEIIADGPRGPDHKRSRTRSPI